MNINDIYRIMDRFESGITSELELELDGVRLSLKKGGSMAVSSNTAGMINNAQQTGYVQTEPAPDATFEVPTAEDASKVIKSPLLGVFYAAPAEGEEPYVKPGDTVKKGDVVGIIEAMKLMNEIEADEEGIVDSIEAVNGEMVEYGQVLIRLK